MNPGTIYGVAGILLFVLGLHGFLIRPHVFRKLLGLNVASAGVFLMLVALAYRDGNPDPVPHALVLTGIVISVSATAYGIALAARRLHVTGSSTLEDHPGDEPS